MILFIYLGSLTLMGYMTQTCLTRSALLKRASYLLPFGYTGIIAGFLFDVLIFDTSFNWAAILGMILTSVGLLGKLLLKED